MRGCLLSAARFLGSGVYDAFDDASKRENSEVRVESATGLANTSSGQGLGPGQAQESALLCLGSCLKRD